MFHCVFVTVYRTDWCIDLFSCEAARVFNKLTHLLTYFPVSHKTLPRRAVMRNTVIWSKSRYVLYFLFSIVSSSHELCVAVNDVVLARQNSNNKKRSTLASGRQSYIARCLFTQRQSAWQYRRWCVWKDSRIIHSVQGRSQKGGHRCIRPPVTVGQFLSGPVGVL